MPLWTLTRAPFFKLDAVPTESGWEDPDTGEVLVAIGELNKRRTENIDDLFENLLLENGYNMLSEQEDEFGRNFYILME